MPTTLPQEFEYASGPKIQGRPNTGPANQILTYTDANKLLENDNLLLAALKEITDRVLVLEGGTLPGPAEFPPLVTDLSRNALLPTTLPVGIGYSLCSVLGYLTNATTVDITQTLSGQFSGCIGSAVFCNNVWTYVTASAAGEHTQTVPLTGTGTRPMLIFGSGSYQGSPGDLRATARIDLVKFPAGTTNSKIAYEAKPDRLFYSHDSNGSGYLQPIPPRDSVMAKLQIKLPDIDVLSFGWSGKQLPATELLQQAEVDAMSAAFEGAAGRKIYWLQVGINNELNTSQTAAQAAAYAGQLLDRVHERDASIEVFFATPTAFTVGHNSPSTPAEFNTAFKALADTRPYLTMRDHSTLVPTGKLKDGVHYDTDAIELVASDVAAVVLGDTVVRLPPRTININASNEVVRTGGDGEPYEGGTYTVNPEARRGIVLPAGYDSVKFVGTKLSGGGKVPIFKNNTRIGTGDQYSANPLTNADYTSIISGVAGEFIEIGFPDPPTGAPDAPNGSAVALFAYDLILNPAS